MASLKNGAGLTGIQSNMTKLMGYEIEEAIIAQCSN